MINEIQKEVCNAIEEIFEAASEADYIAFILFLGRAEIMQGLKSHCLTDCVIEYMWDIYLDESRVKYYLSYLRKNYSKEGYIYQDDNAINSITSELTIYSQIWDSDYFMKSIYRLSAIVLGQGYLWNDVLPTKQVHKHFCENVIIPLKQKGFKLGFILDKSYKPSMRNAFAHSKYNIALDERRIFICPRSGSEYITFDSFQARFLYSVFLMNRMENYQETAHNYAANKGTILTEPFFTPDGVRVQICGKKLKIGNKNFSEFRLIPVKND